jgi:hypothetical protein
MAIPAGASSCSDEGGTQAAPVSAAGSLTSYSSTDSTFNDALAHMSVCRYSGDGTGITFTFPPNTTLPAGPLELRVSGVRDSSGNLISPDPTIVTVNANTQSGSPVTVAPADATTGTTPVSLTFTSAQAGNTSVTSSTTGPTPPQNFQVVGTYYEIQTTSAFTPPIKVCLSYSGPTPRLYHYVASATPPWVDITSDPDTTATTVCGFTDTLSPFALMVGKATPSVTWTTPAPITYGTALSGAQLNATASVAGTFAYDPLTGAILPAGTRTLSVTFTPADTTTYATVSASVLLTVNKATPTITWSDPADILEGTPLSGAQLNATASVPGTLTYSPPSGTVLDVGTQTLLATFSPSDTANYTAPSGAVHVRVINVAPAVTINGPGVGAIYAVNSSITLLGSFSDPGPADTHTAQWTFTSGPNAVVVPGSVSESQGSGSATATYAFTAAGVYYVSLTVTDKDGGSGSAGTIGGASAFVVVYDPSAGYVTGGGWIDSPAGSFSADPSLTGKATFGFVSQYKAGATKPTGNTEFQFQVANLNFHGESYDWLVVAGARAQFKGTGTINGSGSFGSMLTAIDGDLPGGGGIDRFRIKIWDNATGQLVYDNQLGASDGSDPTTALGGGSIVIHK